MAKKAKEGEVKYLTTKDIAAIHKVKPAFLRRVLRSLSKYQDEGYTRYKWEEGDPFLATLGKTIEKYKEKQKEANAARIAQLKEKSKGKAAKSKGNSKKKSAKEPEEKDDEDAEELV